MSTNINKPAYQKLLDENVELLSINKELSDKVKKLEEMLNNTLNFVDDCCDPK